MKWYCLRREEVPPEGKKALVDKRVPITELDIGLPRSMSVIAFPEEERQRVLEVLKISNTLLRETKTDRENLWLLSVEGVNQFATVKVANWNGNNSSGFAKAAAILLPLVGTDIILSVPHKKIVPPAADEFFHIWIWSAPVGEPTQIPPEKIWGVRVDCMDEGYQPSGLGIPIVDSATGYAVAELVENNLYVFHDLCHHGTDREIEIFRHLLDEVAKILSLSPKEREERMKVWASLERQRSKEAYIRECMHRLDHTIKATQEGIKDAERQIEDAQRQIVEATRKLSGLQKKLEQLKNSSATVATQFAEEFEKLMAVPGIIKVNVRDGIISIFTEKVKIKYEGVVYDIGSFRVDIYTDGKNGGVRCFNLTRTVNGYHHPHIQGDGKPCLGNIADGVAKLIGEYQYSVLAQVMLQYLCSVNPSSWYCKIQEWPVVSPAKEVKDGGS